MTTIATIVKATSTVLLVSVVNVSGLKDVYTFEVKSDVKGVIGQFHKLSKVLMTLDNSLNGDAVCLDGNKTPGVFKALREGSKDTLGFQSFLSENGWTLFNHTPEIWEIETANGAVVLFQGELPELEEEEIEETVQETEVAAVSSDVVEVTKTKEPEMLLLTWVQPEPVKENLCKVLKTKVIPTQLEWDAQNLRTRTLTAYQSGKFAVCDKQKAFLKTFFTNLTKLEGLISQDQVLEVYETSRQEELNKPEVYTNKYAFLVGADKVPYVKEVSYSLVDGKFVTVGGKTFNSELGMKADLAVRLVQLNGSAVLVGEELATLPKPVKAKKALPEVIYLGYIQEEVVAEVSNASVDPIWCEEVLTFQVGKDNRIVKKEVAYTSHAEGIVTKGGKVFPTLKAMYFAVSDMYLTEENDMFVLRLDTVKWEAYQASLEEVKTLDLDALNKEVSDNIALNGNYLDNIQNMDILTSEDLLQTISA